MKRLFKALLIVTVMMGMFTTLAVNDAQIVEAATVKISAKTKTIYLKNSATLKITGTKSKVTWSSSNKKIATVTSKGKVTAVKKGTATITAKVGKKKYTCKVTVKNPILNKSNVSIYKGKTYTLSVTGGSGTIAWSSSDTSIATVNSSGKVTAKKAGTTTISAKRNGITMTCKVTVNNVLDVAKTSVSVVCGSSAKVNVTLKTKGIVYWDISNTDIVKCSWGDWNGSTIPLTITGKMVGKTNVTITNNYNSEKYVITVNVTGDGFNISSSNMVLKILCLKS